MKLECTLTEKKSGLASTKTDVFGRFVANIIISTLEKNGPGKTFLLYVEELQKTNNSTIFKLFVSQ